MFPEQLQQVGLYSEVMSCEEETEFLNTDTVQQCRANISQTIEFYKQAARKLSSMLLEILCTTL
jgi:hypothetical protein